MQERPGDPCVNRRIFIKEAHKEEMRNEAVCQAGRSLWKPQKNFITDFAKGRIRSGQCCVSLSSGKMEPGCCWKQIVLMEPAPTAECASLWHRHWSLPGGKIFEQCENGGAFRIARLDCRLFGRNVFKRHYK